jgi:hypothetical protein
LTDKLSHDIKIVPPNKKKAQQVTKGFVQLGLNIEAIIGSAYPSFSFGRWNSAGQ